MLFIVFTIGIMLAYQIKQFRELSTKLSRSIDMISDNQRDLFKKLSDFEKSVKSTPSVTPPFEAANRKRSQGASTKNRILMKTADQIRYENRKKLKEGQSYGYLD